MKNLFTRAWNTLFVLAVFLFFSASSAFAAQPTCGTDSQGKPIETSFLSCEGTGTSSITAIVLLIINIVAAGVGIAVVGGLAFGGLVYAQSGGDAGKVKEAKNIIINSVIGLILFFIMWAGANFLVPGGLFR